MTESEKTALDRAVFLRGAGGIRTLVPRRANAFRVRPVMTTSIRLRTSLFYLKKIGMATPNFYFLFSFLLLCDEQN